MDDDEQNLNAQLRHLWEDGRFDEFFEVVKSELWTPICNYLMDETNFGLSQQDAEDCVSQVLAKLTSNGTKAAPRRTLEYPKTFLWRSCINAATDLKRAAKKRVRIFSEEELKVERYRHGATTQAELDAENSLATTSSGIATDTASIIISALSDEEPAPHWAALVIERAIARLTPKLRAVIEYLIKFGFDSDADEAAKALGMRRGGTFRQRKLRAYKQLAQTIPEEMRRLGIKPVSPRVEEAIFFEALPEIGALDEPGNGS